MNITIAYRSGQVEAIIFDEAQHLYVQRSGTTHSAASDWLIVQIFSVQRAKLPNGYSVVTELPDRLVIFRLGRN